VPHSSTYEILWIEEFEYSCVGGTCCEAGSTLGSVFKLYHFTLDKCPFFSDIKIIDIVSFENN
jgi:hypothetical protein